jgi:hypothetical protein
MSKRSYEFELHHGTGTDYHWQTQRTCVQFLEWSRGSRWVQSIFLLMPFFLLTSRGFFQHGGVSISTFIGWINQICAVPAGEWDLYPCQSIVLLVVRRLIATVRMSLNPGAT